MSRARHCYPGCAARLPGMPVPDSARLLRCTECGAREPISSRPGSGVKIEADAPLPLGKLERREATGDPHHEMDRSRCLKKGAATARARNRSDPIRAGCCLRMEGAATGRVQANKCVRLRSV